MQTQLVPGVFWVGFVDWRVRDFHGYRTERGSSYNAYLVVDEAVAVIDSVKAPYAAKLLEHIAAHVALEKVTYVICNHAEPDHSSSLPVLMAACPQATVVCNRKCREALAQHFDSAAWSFKVVADGESLSLGRRNLRFFDTPMVHWPESMATFLVEDRVLFSMDAFGQHYASSCRFDDEAPIDVVMAEAKTYYANIVMPYGKPVQTALGRLGGLAPAMLAPSHGVIWRGHISRILSAYTDWAVCRPQPKVVILYATMWESTRLMAEAMADGVLSRDVDLRLIDLNTVHDTQVATEVIDCACLAVGSSTLNMGIMPRMASTLTYLRGLRPAGKQGVAFGSYGWAGKAADEAAAYLKATGVTLLGEPLQCRFKPDAAMLQACRAMGVRLADAAMAAAQR